MKPQEIDLHYVARLARLTLSEEESSQIGAQLSVVLTYIDKLKEVNVEGVEPTAHAFPLINVMRQDEVRPSLSHEEAMRNAPLAANGLFLVPKIVE